MFFFIKNSASSYAEFLNLMVLDVFTFFIQESENVVGDEC